MGLFPKNLNEYVALMGIPQGPNSQVYVVDPVNGDDDNPGTNWEAPLATLAEAEDKCTANQHDTVLYVSGSSGINLSAALTWDKSYTHLVGVAAPTGVATRARLFQLSTLTGASPLLNITASGCIFKNFYIFQGVDDATSLINVQVTGGRNYFEDVHFAGGGHATMAINGAASLKLAAAEENRFVRCTFGVDTIAAGTGCVALLLDGEAHRNKFEDCYFTMYAGHAGAAFVEVADATGFDRYTIFKNCLFTNTASQAMTEAFVIPAGVGAPRTIYVLNSFLHGATDWESNDRGVVFISGSAITGGTTAGIMQVSAA